MCNVDSNELIHFLHYFICIPVVKIKLTASLVAQMLKRLPAMQEIWVRSLGWEDPLEKEMATHSSILAWRIPCKEEPGRLQSMASQSRTLPSDFTFTIKNISNIKLEVTRHPFSSVSKLLILSLQFRPENATLCATWQKKLIPQDLYPETLPK